MVEAQALCNAAVAPHLRRAATYNIVMGVARVAAGMRLDGRFTVLDQIGSGGMGEVYRARDDERGVEVALKVLSRSTGGLVLRFKREFRSLANIVHPNIVSLYELLSVGELWCFTMELVDGRSFLRYVRDIDARCDSPITVTSTVGTMMPLREPPTREIAAGTPPPQLLSGARRGLLDVERLRESLLQLAQGVHALHCTGQLHCDIKPSNLLVEDGGRVVVCDFGLVRGVSELAADDTSRGTVSGTPSYMSPEQAAGAPLTPASDWYSVGVVLYECLTGRKPFHGTMAIRVKQERDPVPPIEREPSCPPDLDALCRALLSRDPAARPHGEEIIAHLGDQSMFTVPVRAQTSEPVPASSERLVGRDRHRAALRAALTESTDGQLVAQLVRGRSGMGKSALMERFLDELRVSGEAVVLAGRCYERESVPYKALDAIIDALTAHLRRLEPAMLATMVPSDVASLERLFPVLAQLPLPDSFDRGEPPRDPQVLKRRAFGVLADLLGRLAATSPVVVAIDDLQWGDVDSAGFLADLIRDPHAPPLLLMGAYRAEDEDSSPVLRMLLEGDDDARAAEPRILDVGPLSAEEVWTLVSDGDGSARAVPAWIEQVVREAGGNPFFVLELARAARHGEVGARASDGSLDDVVYRRVSELRDDARRLLATAAVAARPLPIRVIAEAAGLQNEITALTLLRNERLVRTRKLPDYETVEPYHDRIRETVVARLPAAALGQTHLRLANSLEANAPDNALALVDHWLGADQAHKAGVYAERAAEQAADKLAFHRAAQHYELALSLRELSDEERRDLLERLATVLVHAGRLSDAADAYLKAAAGATGDTAVTLTRLATEQLLRGGRLREGFEAGKSLFHEVGLALPKTPNRALFRLILFRMRPSLRRFRYEIRDDVELTPAMRQRLEICWSLSSGLALVDPLFAKYTEQRFMLEALRACHERWLLLARVIEISTGCQAGEANWRQRKPDMVQLVEDARAYGEPHALGICLVTAGVTAYIGGDWRTGVDWSVEAVRVLMEQVVGGAWEASIARSFWLSNLLQLGEIRELIRLVPEFEREAVDRGDHFAAIGLRTRRTNVTWLALDDPAGARHLLDTTETPTLLENRFHLQHYYEFLSSTQIELYCGNGTAAWQRVQADWPGLKRSLLLRIQAVEVEALFARGRAAILAAMQGGDRAALLRDARKTARRLWRVGAGWGGAMASLLRGNIALVDGDRDAARTFLEGARDAFETADMHLLRAVTDYQLETIGGTPERDPIAWMHDQGIVAPTRLAAMFSPALGLAH